MKKFFSSWIFIAIAAVFFVAVVFKLIYSYTMLKEKESEYAMQQAKMLKDYGMAHRSYYQNLFVDKTLKLNDKTLKALPAFSSLLINKTFSETNSLDVEVKTVSDRARNPKNQASAWEMKAIEFFRANKDKTEYFDNKDNNSYYYAEVLKVKQKCLKCHGNKKDAPLFIQKRYNMAYNYKLGEVRGVLSVKISKQKLHQYFFHSFLKSVFYDLSMLGALFLIMFYLVKRSKQFNDFLSDEVDKKTKELKHVFKYDNLTGLPNRLKLISDMQKSYNQNTNRHLAFINIDGFKDVNELYGYKVGDEIIKKVASKILKNLPEHSHFYKLPGDEYAVFDTKFETQEEFIESIEFVLDAIQGSEIDVEGKPILTFSCGLVSNEDMMLAKVDMALQKAKDENKHIVCYQTELDTKGKIAQNMKSIAMLRDAISNNTMVPFFQPIYNPHKSKIEKYECLARIVLDDGRVVAPYAFIDIAMKAKLYPNITEVMIKKSFDYFCTKPEYEFSINLSMEDILNQNTVALIKEELSSFSHPQNVVFEILESSKVGNYEVLQKFIREIKQFGCKFAVDDFGSGYSNFAHILELNFDYLKIDSSIVKYITTDENSRVIAKTIINFASSLGLKTIAEFVEDKDIMDELQKMGVDFMQGYYIGKPSNNINDTVF